MFESYFKRFWDFTRCICRKFHDGAEYGFNVLSNQGGSSMHYCALNYYQSFFFTMVIHPETITDNLVVFDYLSQLFAKRSTISHDMPGNTHTSKRKTFTNMQTQVFIFCKPHCLNIDTIHFFKR